MLFLNVIKHLTLVFNSYLFYLIRNSKSDVTLKISGNDRMTSPTVNSGHLRLI